MTATAGDLLGAAAARRPTVRRVSPVVIAVAALAAAGLVVRLASRGALTELWWTYNLAAIVVAPALALGLAGASAVAGFVLALGPAAWLVDGGAIDPLALALRIGVLACALAGMRALRIPRNTWRRSVTAIAVVTAASGWLASGDANFALRVPARLPALAPAHGVFLLTWLAALAIAALALQLAIVLAGIARSTRVPIDPALVSPAPPPGRPEGEPEAAWRDLSAQLGGPRRQDRNAHDHPALASYARHVNPAQLRLLGMLGHGRVYVHASDVWIWDHEGRRYLDCLAGYSSVNIGHNHPRIVGRLTRQLHDHAMNFVQVGPCVRLAELGARIARIVQPPLSRIIATNGGAEAVEAGLKLSRMVTGRARWVYCAGAYHGSSLGTISVMGADGMRRPLSPLLPDCERVPFGDLDALARALAGGEVGGFLVDPGLCESGRVVAPAGYLSAARELCRAHGTLMILDEIQTGLGRQGVMFVHQAEGFVPDILLFAKSLSGGVAPIGVAVTTAEIHDRACGSVDQIDTFSSTFGGNSFSCTAALAALDILEDERLVDNSRERGAELLAGLRDRLGGHPLIHEIRGRGLMVAIELGAPSEGWLARLAPSWAGAITSGIFGLWVTVQLLERGLLCQTATYHANVIKLMPPLTIRRAEIETIVRVIGELFDAYRDPAIVAADVTARLAGQALAGWAF